MKDYKQLLKELPSNTVVCALGDFDPPTVAHELLVKTVTRLAESKGSAHVIFTSPSKTLQEDKKSQYLKLMFPKTNFTSIEESFTSSVEKLKQKYKNVIVVVGTEQSTGLKKALKESVEFVAITEKNPDADTSKMKSFATKALYEEFKKKLPTSIREIDGKRLMNDVRAGMGLEPVKEQLNLVKDTLREQYFRGEIFNEGDIVESNGAHYTIVKRGSNHLLLKEESGELVSKWIHDVKSVNEAVIQPGGTDQVVPSSQDKVDSKDQNGNPIPRDKGNKKGFLTFYGYTKDNNEFKVAKMEQYQYHSTSDVDKDNQSDLDADLQQLQIYDPKEVGHSMTNPIPHKGSHHLRRMKIQRHFKEHLEEAKKKKELPNTDVARNGMDCAGGSGERMTPVSEDKDIELEKDAPTVDAIAKKHGVSTEHIHKQLAIGMKVEAEHGKNPGSEREIAMDHLNERPDYYTRLKKFVEQVKEQKHELGIDHDEPMSRREHIMSTIAKHGGKITGQSDKSTYVHFHADKVEAAKRELKAGRVQPSHWINGEFHESVEQIQELSKDTLKSYIGKATKDMAERKRQQQIAVDRSNQPRLQGKYGQQSALRSAVSHSEKAVNRATNIGKAALKFAEELEQIEEVKKKAVCPTCGKHECECGEQRPQTSKEMNPAFDPFFKEEEDFSDKDIDRMVDSVSDEDIQDLYEEEELTLVYEDNGEEVPASEEEAQIDLMEVLSRQERMKAKFRFRKTAAKRERSTKIALKRYSSTATINKRARRLAIKLIKQRLLRGRDLANVSVQEKERIEKTIANRKNAITRIAAKLTGRIRRVEKSRMSHGQVTKGATPTVF